MSAKEPEWKRLQRKVFTRWINMKLRLGRANVVIKEDELVTSWGTGYNLVALLQVLSGKQFGKKLKKDLNMRVQQIDQCNRALTFAWQVGVDMELKPSAENLVDGTERQVMGLVWAIMRSFLSFDNDSLSIQDALLLWVNNQVAEYGLRAKNFKRDWHDGRLFCALIHKYRPRLIGDFPPTGTPHENIKLAMDGAEKFFGLEQYLAPEDIEVLDDKSMIIYVAEYYYGITGFQKVYQAAKRVGNLMAYTQENDRLRDEYAKLARQLRDDLAEASNTLQGIEVDNTLEGAKRNIAEFQKFKDQKKAGLTNDYLTCESIMNTLSERLASQNRPRYQAEEGCALEDLRQGLSTVDTAFAQHNNTLYAELARQIRLHKLNDQHKKRYGQLKTWAAAKQAYLEQDLSGISSSGDAKFAYNKLKAYQQESAAVHDTVPDWKKMGEELTAEKFELLTEVQEREADFETLARALGEKSAENERVLDDALKREKFKEDVRTEVAEHQERFQKLWVWLESSEAANVKPEVNLSTEARQAVDRFDVAASDRADKKGAVEALQKAGRKIVEAEYKSDLSAWVYEEREVISQEDEEIASRYADLEAAATEIQEALADDVKRLSFKESVETDIAQHGERTTALETWIEAAQAANTKPAVDSVEDAQQGLAEARGSRSAREERRPAIAALRAFGQSIREAKYASPRSEWSAEDPGRLEAAEAGVERSFQELETAAAEILAQLEDDLPREQFRADLNDTAADHGVRHEQLISWIRTTEAQTKKPEVGSVGEAQEGLAVIGRVLGDVNDHRAPAEALRDITKSIATAKYSSERSEYSYPELEAVQAKQTEVDEGIAGLEATATEIQAALRDDLAREEFRAALDAQTADWRSRQEQFGAWVQQALQEVVRPEVQSVPEAKAGLAKIKQQQADIADHKPALQTLTKLAREIQEARFESERSSYESQEKEEIAAGLAEVTEQYEKVSGVAPEILAQVQDDLARETFKADLLQRVAQHSDRHANLRTWLQEHLDSVRKPEMNSVPEARTAQGKHKVVQAEIAEKKSALEALRDLGRGIAEDKYETPLSQYACEAPEQLAEQQAEVDELYGKLVAQAEDVQAGLEDDEARELVASKARSLDQQHQERFKRLQEWLADVRGSLEQAAEIQSIQDAQRAVGQLDVSDADREAHQFNIQGLKDLGEALLNLKHSSERSEYSWTQPEEVAARHAEVEEHFAALAGLAEGKRKTLDAALEAEVAKDTARLDFATAAGDVQLWIEAQMGDAGNHDFGETLEEVEAFDATGKADGVRAELQTRHGAVLAADGKQKELGVKSNQYTELTVPDLEASGAELETALQTRQGKYEERMEELRAVDALCKQYAEAAEPLAQKIDGKRDQITKSVEELQAQLDTVQAEQAGFPSLREELAGATTVGVKVQERGIQNNPHTLLSNAALESSVNQYEEFLAAKAKSLGDQIETAKMKGLTVEQYNEIVRNFKTFDKDGSNAIDADELKNCLYSLGENQSSEEIEELIKEYGQDGQLSLEGFTDYFIHMSQKSNTKENVADSFDILANGAPAQKIEDLENVFNDEQLDYLRKTAPQTENGDVDFRQWVEDQYAR